jgi:hypothetical protein
VDVNGNISLIDTASFDEFPVSSWDLRNKVMLDTAGDGISKFFNGKGFMTTYIAGSLKLTVVTWSVDAQGMITFVDRMQTLGEVKNQAISSTTSIVALRMPMRTCSSSSNGPSMTPARLHGPGI